MEDARSCGCGWGRVRHGDRGECPIALAGPLHRPLHRVLINRDSASTSALPPEADIRRIGRHTTLARANRTTDPIDLPRIEMWYFRNIDHWRTHLEGRAQGYFRRRQLLRRARAIVAAGPPGRVS